MPTAPAPGCQGPRGRLKAVAKHFVAVSTNAEKFRVRIDTAKHVRLLRTGCGGRYSMDSAIGLSNDAGDRAENYRAMLAGFMRWTKHSAYAV